MPMNVYDLQESPLQAQISAGMKTAANIMTLRSVAELESCRDLWNQFERHPNSDVDHYLSTIGSLRGVLRPHVMVVQCDGLPEAMLIGRLERKRFDLKLGYSNLLHPHVRSLTFIYGGLLGHLSSESAEDLAGEIVGALFGNEADVAFFNHLRADSPLYAALSRHLGFWRRDRFPALQTHRAMTLPSGRDEFWRRFSPKVRKNQRWQAKKLLTDHGGDVHIRCFREHDDLDLMIHEMERVAAKTYQRGLDVGFAYNEFTRNLLRLKAEKGWLRGYVLYVRGCPAAFWLGTLCSGTFHSDAMGYDPEFGKYSPGMYTIMKVIEDFCEREREAEVSAIDFGLGDAPYKEMLADVSWQDASFYAYAPNVRGVALYALRTPLALLDKAAKAALERTQLIQRVKTAWRRRVRNNITN